MNRALRNAQASLDCASRSGQRHLAQDSTKRFKAIWLIHIEDAFQLAIDVDRGKVIARHQSQVLRGKTIHAITSIELEFLAEGGFEILTDVKSGPWLVHRLFNVDADVEATSEAGQAARSR